MKKKVTIVLLSTLVSACAGGTFGGLLPAPKLLKGHLDGLTYTAPDHVFSVEAPASEENGEWRYTVVKEHAEQHPDQTSRFVGFKTPYDNHFYSVEVVQLLNASPLTAEQFALVKNHNLARIVASTETRWASQVETVAQSQLQCSNQKSYSYSVYKQHITSYSPNFDKYFLVSQSYEGNSVVVVTSELNFDSSAPNQVKERINTLTYAKHNALTCSVTLGG